MLKENYTKQEKIAIARYIKDIKIEHVEEEMNKLIKIGEKAETISERSKIGNDVVDYFLWHLAHRL